MSRLLGPAKMRRNPVIEPTGLAQSFAKTTAIDTRGLTWLMLRYLAAFLGKFLPFF